MAQSGFVFSEKTQEALVTEAVDFVQAAVSSGALSAAASRAEYYAGDKIWSQLTKDWSGRNCRWLAHLARITLDGKDWLHGRVGKVVVVGLELLGMPHIVCLFGKELAQRIPMPWDHQLVVVARGMQIAGITICVLQGKELARCSCFVDVVVAEGKERMRQIVVKAVDNWRELSELALAT
jgi:hypothetical protein